MQTPPQTPIRRKEGNSTFLNDSNVSVLQAWALKWFFSYIRLSCLACDSAAPNGPVVLAQYAQGASKWEKLVLPERRFAGQSLALTLWCHQVQQQKQPLSNCSSSGASPECWSILWNATRYFAWRRFLQRSECLVPFVFAFTTLRCYLFKQSWRRSATPGQISGL